MIKLKTEQEIEIMQEAGRKLKKVVKELLPKIKSGITTAEIDARADALIKKHRGEASFKRVKNYYWSTCLPVNEQAVHSPPSSRKLKEGDLLTVDIGVYHKGYNTDFATSFIIGKETSEKKDFLRAGKETLSKALKTVRSGHYLGEVSQVIEDGITKNGYKVLKKLTGHGIGKNLHEDPYVLQFLDRPVEKTYKMRPGLVIAVEVIYSQTTEDMIFEKGSTWSIITADGSLAACFEHTIALTQSGPMIIT